jgi:Fic family protein
MTWNWQQSDWPNFRYEAARLKEREAQFLHSAGVLFGVIKHLDAEAGEQLRIELLSDEALQTSAIEGEILNRRNVQSSLRREFGLRGNDLRASPAEQGIAEMMADLYRNFDRPLDPDVLFRWHKMLMKGRRDLHDIGRYRTHSEPMQVVSGRLDKPTIHFEAPPSKSVPKEMGYIREGAGPRPGSSNAPRVGGCYQKPARGLLSRAPGRQ